MNRLIGVLASLCWSTAVLAGPNYSAIRGANYVPSYASTSIAAWKNYQPTVIDRELGCAKKLGLNSVRVFLQYVVYEHDPALFLKRVDDFLQCADRHGLTVMFVLFDSCFGDEPAIDKGESEKWLNNPGYSRLSDKKQRPKLEKYVADIVRPRIGDRRVIMWDIMNEPEADFNHVTAGERQTINAFCRHFCKYVKQLDPGHPITVGHAVVEYIPRTMDVVDVLSVHSYMPFEDWLQKDLDVAIAYGRKAGKPVIVTEFGNPGEGQKYEMALPLIERNQLGFYFWELMIGKIQFKDFSGLIYPDGTIRDPASIAAFLGYRVKADGIPIRKPPDRTALKKLADDPARWPEIIQKGESAPRTKEAITALIHPLGMLGRHCHRPSEKAAEVFDAGLAIGHLFRMGKEKEAVAEYERLLRLTREGVELKTKNQGRPAK